MPYEVFFARDLPPLDRGQYINECCIGGDLVVNQLLPAVRARYTHVETHQEDWGWFIWFRKDHVRLAIDVLTDDPVNGVFRIHLTSRTKRWLIFDTVVDTVELEELLSLITSELVAWSATDMKVTRLNRDYMEEETAL